MKIINTTVTRTEIFGNIYRNFESMKDTPKSKANFSYILVNYIRLLMKDNSLHMFLCVLLKCKYNMTICEKRIQEELSTLQSSINTDLNYTKLENYIFSKLLKILRDKNISIDKLNEIYIMFLSLVFEGGKRIDYLESHINKFDDYLYAVGNYKNIYIRDYDPTYLMDAKEKVKELTIS